MLTRRGLVGVFLAAPVIIRTPGLLMPIKPFVLEPVTNPPPPTAEPVWVSEALWRVEIVTDGAGVITGTKLYRREGSVEHPGEKWLLCTEGTGA
jgi:hypothetical protein